MTIVTGATGQLGPAIAERLLERVPAGQVGVSDRDPEKARLGANRHGRPQRTIEHNCRSAPCSAQQRFEGSSLNQRELASGRQGEARRPLVALPATTSHERQCSTDGIDSVNVVGARRRKVEDDLGRLADRHAGTRIDVAAAARALATESAPAGDTAQRGIGNDPCVIDGRGRGAEHVNAAA